MYSMLSAAFPEHEWLPWKFDTRKEFWGDLKNQRKFMDWISGQLNVREPNDWYSVGQKVRKN
jgi:hypothetical protein